MTMEVRLPYSEEMFKFQSTDDFNTATKKQIEDMAALAFPDVEIVFRQKGSDV